MYCEDKIIANFPIDRTFSLIPNHKYNNLTDMKKKAPPALKIDPLCENFSRESVGESTMSNWKKIVWHYRRIY